MSKKRMKESNDLQDRFNEFADGNLFLITAVGIMILLLIFGKIFGISDWTW